MNKNNYFICQFLKRGKMISKFDALQHSVKLYEAKIKGKVKDDVDLGHLSMSVIIEKNKKIDMANKMHKLHVVKARQLRIKISQIFNTNLKLASPFQNKMKRRSQSNTNSPRFSLHNLRMSTQVKHSTQKRALSYKFLPKQSQMAKLLPRKTILKEQQHPQMGGMFNLFQKFSEEEINQIQSDQHYYLVSSDIIELFRKFMAKKRMNNKDHSYEKFMLRNHREHNELPSQKVAKMSQSQIKRFILDRIGEKKTEVKESKIHLLTNPIFTQLQTEKSAEGHKRRFHNSNGAIFSQLKKRQMQNEQKLRVQQQKKRRKLKIDIFYQDGIAAESRAVQMDKKKLLLTQRNFKDLKKSLECRKRIATVREQYGQSVDLAQKIRKEFVRKRTQLQKFRYTHK